MSQRLINLTPPYYKKSKIANDILGAIESESDRFVEFALDVIRQGNPRLATWGIGQWEKDMKLPAVPKETTIDQRRARVLSRFGTPPVVTPREMERLLSEFTRNRNARVVEYGREKRFAVEIDIDNAIDLVGMASVAQEMKPKHLTFEVALGVKDVLTFHEQVFMTQRRYHKLNELRLGMTLLKYENEVKV
ncbi:putative phage tail protein [Brevibacillus sp. FSL L8-0520]|uniref:putative phage tail protein n=1 Tax=Brevibacillus sp. FSL L8-0520 TaxID=2954689 RepID=UPI0030D567A4